jgi:broad specificity phosphatase PhoE
MIVHLLTHAHTHQQPAVDSRHWALSDVGKAQAAALIQAPIWARVCALVVSSEPKTRLTAEPVAEHYNLPIYVDARFDELQRGGWIDDYAATVTAAFAAPTESIAGWETATSALSRALDALADWEAQASHSAPPGDARGEIAIVGHGLSLSLLRAWFLTHAALDSAAERAVNINQVYVDADEWRRLPFGAWATFDTEARRIVQDFAYGEAAR